MKTILIVDPDSVSDGMSELLRRGGFASMVTPNAGAAIEKVRGDAPLDLIITEMLLPDMSGIDFLNIVRSTRPGLPVLVITACGSLESYVHAIQLGAIDYLNKPICAKELHRIMNMVFDPRGPADQVVPPHAA